MWTLECKRLVFGRLGAGKGIANPKPHGHNYDQRCKPFNMSVNHLPMGVVHLLVLERGVAKFSHISISIINTSIRSFARLWEKKPSDLIAMEWSNLKAQFLQFLPTLLNWCMAPLLPKLTKKWRNSKLQCSYLIVFNSNWCIHKYIFPSAISIILHRRQRCTSKILKFWRLIAALYQCSIKRTMACKLHARQSPTSKQPPARPSSSVGQLSLPMRTYFLCGHNHDGTFHHLLSHTSPRVSVTRLPAR